MRPSRVTWRTSRISGRSRCTGIPSRAMWGRLQPAEGFSPILRIAPNRRLTATYIGNTTMLESIVQDVRYGIRQLKQSPGFTAIAVLSLALGIGANTAIFQLIDVIRLKMLPVHNPQELASIDFEKGSSRSGWFSTRSARLTYAQGEQIRASQQAFTDVLAWSATRFNLANGGEARYAEGLFVSGDFFRALGVNLLMGRTFAAADDSESCGGVGAVISYAFWQRELGGDPLILGRNVMLNGFQFPILGVTPAAFFGVEVGSRYDVTLPLCADRILADDGKGRIPVRH